jgi:hypothetical protein
MTVFPLPQDRNRRATARKAIRGPATVVQGEFARPVQMWDLGRDGMCLLAPRPIAPGTRCAITFELQVGGAPATITAAAKVVYSSYSAPGEFKIGAVFTDLDASAARLLEAFAAAG